MLQRNKIIDAFSFYNINKNYLEKCIIILEEIKKNSELYESFKKIYEILYLHEIDELKELWEIENLDNFYNISVDPFINNLMLILGYEIHKENMKKLNFNKRQIILQKKRIKECFENDLIKRNYLGIRISQLLWGIYFIRGKIIEVGSLQFEKVDNKIIKIHIPKNTNLNIGVVKESLILSRIEIEKIYKISNFKYCCESWLLSNQIHNLVGRESNIFNFYNLFEIVEGKECLYDILNFVFNMKNCNDFNTLEEKTSLQHKIKDKLIIGEKFYLGIGTLKGVDK